MGKTAFIFPGQGSQSVGMGQSLAKDNEQIAQLFKRADERLDFSLSDIIFNGPAEQLTLTANTQPAILTTSIAVLEAMKAYDLKADYVAGHSLGEYSALVAAGAMSFEDAVYAVRMRGTFMEEAVPAGEGAMAAILGMERDQLQEVTNEVTAGGNTVELANLNSPGQIVISGTARGVELASELAKEKGAKRAIPLQVSGPFHSSLLKPAADKLAKVMDEITINDANIPVIANVSASEVTEASKIRENLLVQVYSPVLWEDSVKRLLDLGVDTFIEVGPGNVLSTLVKKIHRRAKVFAISDQESLINAVEKLKEEE